MGDGYSVAIWESSFAKGYKKGFRIGYEKGRLEACVASLRALMQRQGITVEEAMDMIGVPEEDRERVVTLLSTTRMSWTDLLPFHAHEVLG